MEQAWTHGPYTWATNGRIIVRVPALAEVAGNTDAANAEVLLEKTAPPKEWYPVPACKTPTPIKCDWCDGTGKDPSDKRYKCFDCKGAKTMRDDKSYLRIADAAFAQRYLCLIQGWEIAPNGQNAAWIRKGDALGLLMPMPMLV